MEQGQGANEAKTVIHFLEILQCFELRAQGQGQWIRNQLSLCIVFEGNISYKLPADTSLGLLSPRMTCLVFLLPLLTTDYTTGWS